MHTATSRALLVAAALLIPPGASASAAGDAEITRVRDELARTRSELASTRAELDTTRQTLQQLVDRVDQLESSAARAPAAAAEASGAPRLAAVNVDNPAISFVVDTTAAYDREETGWNFQLRSGELFLSAPIDPFLRGFATLNGSSESGFDIEEAAVVTTALPWNLTVEAGRFFADVGRLPHWHDEALPFVDRPPSIERMIGGESQAEGAQVTWLAPTDQYIRVTGGLYNEIGADRNDQLRSQGVSGSRSFDQLTWLIHPETYFDLTDTLNVELGATAFTVQHQNTRGLYAFDATLRHQPGTSGFYQGFTLGSEWMWSSERVPDSVLGFSTSGGSERFNRNAGYAYLEGYFGRSYSLGVRGDWAVDPYGPNDTQKTWSLFATWMPSEFQRLRLQLDQISRANQHDQQITFQWTAFMGSHSHGFATR